MTAVGSTTDHRPSPAPRGAASRRAPTSASCAGRAAPSTGATPAPARAGRSATRRPPTPTGQPTTSAAGLRHHERWPDPGRRRGARADAAGDVRGSSGLRRAPACGRAWGARRTVTAEGRGPLRGARTRGVGPSRPGRRAVGRPRGRPPILFWRPTSLASRAPLRLGAREGLSGTDVPDRAGPWSRPLLRTARLTRRVFYRATRPAYTSEGSPPVTRDAGGLPLCPGLARRRARPECHGPAGAHPPERSQRARHEPVPAGTTP